MPPKKEEPPPPPEEPVDEGPKFSAEELLAIRMGMSPHPKEEQVEMLLERSAGISHDPKMKHLSGMLSSHTAEDAPTSPAACAAFTGGSRCGLRTGGRDLVDRRMKDLSSQMPRPPTSEGRLQPASPTSLPQLRRSETSPSTLSPLASPSSGEKSQDPEKASRMMMMAKYDTSSYRNNFQHTTDKTLKRLLLDVDLARPDHQKHYSHQTRCDHLDKMHAWYGKHTYKDKQEAQKERKTAVPPPYLLFSQEGPVSPGSLRVQFKHPSPLLSTMHRSSSSPALEGA